MWLIARVLHYRLPIVVLGRWRYVSMQRNLAEALDAKERQLDMIVELRADLARQYAHHCCRS